ncbi:MAG: hypothetical protein A2X31_13780 [Elusimicrobia bacterium GWB2_63_22]|nr:MAG: hypothetical protein A2X31_13780 [Elusimicrobia bacterium GWB2_63_22]
MTVSPKAAKKLAAVRDLSAVLIFVLLVFFGARAVMNAPFFQKERLTRREASEDISEFFARIEKTRPARPEGPAPAGYAAMRAEAEAAAAASLDEFGRIPVKDLAYILYRYGASFGDGATRLLWQPPRKWKDPELKFPPFTVAAVKGKFTIGKALNPSLAGAELLEVNGVPFPRLISPVLERVSGETQRRREFLFCRDQAFWWDFSRLFAGAPALEVKVKSPGGKPYTRKLDAVTAGEFRRLAARPAAPERMLYAQKKIAWLNVTDLAYSRSGRKGYARFFRELKEHGIEDLVLDLRDSSGGDPRAADLLLSYLAGTPGNGPDDAFAGTARLLTGPGTDSAGAYFAARFRELKAGETLGAATGGMPGHFCSPKEFKLSNSGIPYAAASRYCAAPGADGSPVAPDVALTEALLRPHGDVQAFLLDRIAKARAGK